MEKELIWKKVGYIALKTFIFVAFYAILHFLYTDLSANPFFRAIAGTDESVFQHMKIGFFAYLITIGFDFLIIRKKIESKESFLFSRLLSNLLVPWLIFIIWYIVPAIVGKELTLAAELTWAMVVVIFIGIIVSFLDENTEKIAYNLPIKIIIGVLIAVSILIFVWFSFELPWIDVFVLPE